MKRLIVIVLIITFVFVTGCGDPMVINIGVKKADGTGFEQREITFDTYGLFNKDEKMNPEVKYNLIMGNIIFRK